MDPAAGLLNAAMEGVTSAVALSWPSGAANARTANPIVGIGIFLILNFSTELMG